MMETWALQDAKARFSDVVKAATTKGPQIITKRGVETVVVVELKEWKRIAFPTPAETPPRRLSSEELLRVLQSGPAFDIPDRHAERHTSAQLKKSRRAAS